MPARFGFLLTVLVTPTYLLCGAPPTPAQSYDITDLGLLPGARLTEAFAINSRSQVVGLADPPARAFLWEDGELLDIGTLGGSFAVAYDINNRSEIVGVSSLAGNETGHAFVWRAGEFTDLGTLPGGTNSVGYAINDRGQVLGVADTSVGSEHVFLWDESTGMVELPLSLGGDPSRTAPRAINNRGQVVGSAVDLNEQQRAFLWDQGVTTDLGTLGGPRSKALDINGRGEIVGSATRPGELESFAVRWRHGEIEFLGTLGRWSEALAINNRGEIVGVSIALDGYTHAFLWRDGVFRSLNDLIPSNSGWRLLFANDINDSGEIVGVGVIAGEIHAFVLTPNRARQSARK